MSDNEKKFSILVCSDISYEEIVTNLKYDDGLLAILNYDDGIENSKVELMDYKTDTVLWTFDYFEFVKVMEYGYDKLKEINKEVNK